MKSSLIALGMVLLATVVLRALSQTGALGQTSPPAKSLNDELETIVSSVADADKPIKSAVLYVAKGDGSFTWSGASGSADPVGGVLTTADTPVYIASVTKLYTAAMVMMLSETGRLSLDDPMAKYLPDELIRGIQVFEGHDYSHEITVAQLLAQTSCIPDYYDEKARDGKTLFDLLLADPGRTWTVDEAIARARDGMTPRFKPGDKAFYSDTNYQLLGKIIEACVGKPLGAVFEDFLFRPLGLNHTWLVGRSQPLERPAAAVAQVFSKEVNISGIRANTVYWADGGIVSTARDCVTFLKALNQGRIIKPETLAKMHQWKPLANPGMPFQYGYGTMAFVPPSSPDGAAKAPAVWGATGSTGAFLYYAQDLDLYMAGTTNQVADKFTPIVMMNKVMKAFRDRTSALDVLAGKRFGMPIISRGDNIPDFEPTKDSMHLLLIALHKDIPVSEFQAKTGFGPEKMDGILRFLEGKNYLHRIDGRYEPSVFIADAEDGRRLFEYAVPIATEIVDAVKASLPSITETFSRTGMARGRSFEDWAFFILSDVLLDNWQIDTVEREFLKASTRPLRHGKNYYAALMEKNPKNEPFGIFGNQVGDISVYGNNRRRVDAATTDNRISAADGAVLETMARDFGPKLLAVLEKTRPYAEKIFAETGYSKEVAFNEFYIWWYHFIYTRATDLMAEAGMLKVPPDGNFLYQMLER